ncbi:MAG: hypothetical protein WCJ56_03925 [bacterium]
MTEQADAIYEATPAARAVAILLQLYAIFHLLWTLRYIVYQWTSAPVTPGVVLLSLFPVGMVTVWYLYRGPALRQMLPITRWVTFALPVIIYIVAMTMLNIALEFIILIAWLTIIPLLLFSLAQAFIAVRTWARPVAAVAAVLLLMQSYTAFNFLLQGLVQTPTGWDLSHLVGGSLLASTSYVPIALTNALIALVILVISIGWRSYRMVGR